MLKNLFSHQHYLQRHLNAPLLTERETYLKLLKSKAASEKNLRVTAGYLLAIIKGLGLKDEIETAISLRDIENAAIQWSNKKRPNSREQYKRPEISYHKFKNTAINWLEYIGWLDPVYTDSSIIFNKLYCDINAKIRHLTAPFLKERTAYLEYRRSLGAKTNKLKQIAVFQLHLINSLKLKNGMSVTETVLRKAAKKWANIDKGLGRKYNPDNTDAFNNFLYWGKEWLSSMDMYKPKAATLPNKDIVDQYLAELINVRGYSKVTVMHYRSKLKLFLINVGNKHISTLTYNDLDHYINICHQKGYARISIKGMVSSLRAFFSYCSAKGLCDKSLSGCLKSPKIYKLEGLPNYAPWETVQSIIKDGATKNGIWIRNYPIFLLLSLYGMRSREVTGLLLSDINWREETICLQNTKNRRKRLLPLLPMVGNAIIRYIKDLRYNESPDRHLFLRQVSPFTGIAPETVTSIVRKELKSREVDLNHYGAHSLRHSCATNLINSNVTLKEIADILGHVQIESTRIYAKVNMLGLRQVADMNWEGVL